MSSHSLADSLDRGYTLPSTWYTDAGVYRAETVRIFEHSWNYVGLLDSIPGRGDFFTTRVGQVPLLVVRGRDSTARCFVNVCRHRGSELVLEERGTRQSIQCHYHAWTYDLDGALRSAPGSRDEPGFCPAEFSLAPVRLESWGPFLFVNVDGEAPSLPEVLGDLPEQIAATGLALDAIRLRRRDTYEIAANWKVVVDNYLECYHCPVAHPSFTNLIDLDSYQITEYEYFSTQTGPLRQRARAGKRPYNTSQGVQEGFYVYLWPNFMLNIYPGPGNVSLNLIMPTGPSSTRAVYDYCFVPEVTAEESEEFMAFIDVVQKEDIALCESVQRGLASGRLEQGRLLLSRESALRHFQRMVHRFLGDEPTLPTTA